MLSRKVEYGLIALLHMDAEGDGKVISSKEVAETHGISVDLMGKVMQALGRAGLLVAEQGSRGGYRLGSDLENMTLSRVIEAIEGPPKLVRCQMNEHDCIQAPACIVKKPLAEIHRKLNGFIDGITLDQLRDVRFRKVKAGQAV